VTQSGELLCERRTDATAADDDDVHGLRSYPGSSDEGPPRL
jgi:hypothetical protein